MIKSLLGGKVLIGLRKIGVAGGRSYLENAKYLLAHGMHGRMQIKTVVLGKINNSI